MYKFGRKSHASIVPYIVIVPSCKSYVPDYLLLYKFLIFRLKWGTGSPSTWVTPRPLCALIFSVSKFMKAFWIYFILFTVSMVFLYRQFFMGFSTDSYLGLTVFVFLSCFFLVMVLGGKKHPYFSSSSPDRIRGFTFPVLCLIQRRLLGILFTKSRRRSRYWLRGVSMHLISLWTEPSLTRIDVIYFLLIVWSVSIDL